MDDYFDTKDKGATRGIEESDDAEERAEINRPETEEEKKESPKKEDFNEKANSVVNDIKQAINEEKNTKVNKNKNIRTQAMKPLVIMNQKEKQEMELMRRFKVQVDNVKITNLQPDVLDIYLQFMIGGDYQEDFAITPSGRRVITLDGTRGPSQKTELARSVEKDNTRAFKMKMNTEYRGSYFMLKEQKFEIEVWSYSRWGLNRYLGKYSTSLQNIATGNLHRNDLVIKQTDRKALCRIYYTIYFQEIWDWSLTFTDWRVSDLLTDVEKPFEMNPKLSLSLLTDEVLKPSVSTSESRKGDRAPYWDELPGTMTFRGTIDDLESQKLRIVLEDYKTFGISSTLVDRIVPLRGVVDFGIVKTAINLGRPKNLSKKSVKPHDASAHTVGGATQTPAGEGDRPTIIARATRKTANPDELVDPNDENLRDESLQIQIEGRISVGNIPRFRQRGEIVRLKSNSRYVAINIQRIEKIPVPETRATVNTYVSIEWGGQLKRSGIQYDNYQPIFNEDFFFEIPVKVPLLKFSAPGFAKADPLKQLRTELQTNNRVTIDLWLQGEDGTSDNLGNATITFAELADAPREQRLYFDVNSEREVKYVSRVLETKKLMQSAMDPTMQAQLFVECWFLPDMPDGIDLRAYSTVPEDKFPIELDIVNRKDHMDLTWNELIDYNFVRAPLEPVRIKNMKNLFFQDQYGKHHFLSKYIGKMTLEDYNFDQEDIDEKDKQARSVKSLGELAHYVRCIPFKTEGKNTAIWYTPNFIPIMKKGDVQEHALLLACLFMGAKIEEGDSDDEEESDDEAKAEYDEKDIKYPAIENRVFVCIGTLWATKSTHLWVMTLNKRCDKITFWETTSNHKYVLKGRIEEAEVFNLRFFLQAKTGQTLKKKSEQNLFGAFGNFGNFLKGGIGNIGDTIGIGGGGDAAKAKEGGPDSDTRATDKTDKPADKKDKKKDKKKAKVVEEEEEEDMDFDQRYAIEDEQLNVYGDNPVKPEDVTLKVRATTQMKSNFLYNMKREVKFNLGGNQETPQESNNKKKAERSTFIKGQRDEEMKRAADDKEKHLKAVVHFVSRQGEVQKPQRLPYASIDVIFNHKNVWSNMQFPNPAKIKFHLHHRHEWNPYFFLGEEDISKQVPWMDQIGTFYSFRSMGPPLRETEVKRIKENIIKAVNFGVTAARSGKNLETKWKNQKDKIVRHLEDYLRIQERKDKGKIPEEKYVKEVEEWQQKMKTLMPENFRYRARPMFFSYSEDERIKSTIVKQAAEFFMVEEPEVSFALACKIFPYPGQFNSVRTIIAIFSPIPEDELEDEDHTHQDISDLSRGLDDDEEGLLGEMGLE